MGRDGGKQMQKAKSRMWQLSLNIVASFRSLLPSMDLFDAIVFHIRNMVSTSTTMLEKARPYLNRRPDRI